jgi:hypothetical protein
MTDKNNIGWIKFIPSLDLPKERVSIAYDTHDERGIRYAYGYFQLHNGTCTMFWKDGNEQPKSVKAEDIKYWMPIPAFESIISSEVKPLSDQSDGNIYSLAGRYAYEEWDEDDREVARDSFIDGYNICKQQMMKDFPHWEKSTLPNDDVTGFNSEYFCHKGYRINYKELFIKLPKDR